MSSFHLYHLSVSCLPKKIGSRCKIEDRREKRRDIYGRSGEDVCFGSVKKELDNLKISLTRFVCFCDC